MKVFVYDGSVASSPNALAVLGTVFRRGEPTHATDAQARKLRCLPCFVAAASSVVDAAPECLAVVGETAPEPEPEVEQAPEPEPGPVKRKRGRPPGSKNRPKVTNGDEIAG